MYTGEPKRLRPDVLRLLAVCPASTLPRRTKRPDNALVRWKAVMEAITQWYVDGTPTDVGRIERDLFSALDPVQRELCSGAFRSWRTHVGPGGRAGFGVIGPSVVRDDAYLTSAIQLSLSHDDESTEHFKVKLRNPTSEDERAIITVGGDPDADYLEVILDPGQVDSLAIDPARAAHLVDELFTIDRKEVDKNTYVGGFHCWRCDRVSLCRQYPPLGTGPPPSGTPSVVLGKGTLSHLAECPRRVAWKAIFQLGEGDGDLDEPGTAALAMGTHFHAAMAVALLDGDPGGVMRSHARAMAGSEQSEFLGLWDVHRSLQASEGFSVTRTELPIGCTAPAPTAAGTTAVTFLGIADAAGREPDDTPAIIEHRTTTRRDLPHLEQELYAVAGALAVKAERIAVHHHWLRAPVDEACTRRLFEKADIDRAAEALIDAARAIAGWHREDATDAPWVTGDWCRFCPYEPLCARHRD